MMDDPIQAAIDEQYPDDAEEVDDSGTDDVEAVEDEGGVDDAAESLLLGKFKSPDDLAKAYQELEKQFHASRQQPQQPAEEEYDDSEPFWMPGYTTEEAQRLAEYALASPQNAQQAFEYAAQHPGEFGVDHDRITNELFQLWQAQDPRGAVRYEAQQIIAEMRQSMEQEFQPLQQQYSRQAIDLAVNQAAAEYPGFADKMQEVLNHIQSIPGLMEAIDTNPAYRSPENIKGLLKRAYADVMMNDWMQQQHQISQGEVAESASEKPSSRAKTASRSSTAKPAAGDVFDELFGADAFAA